MTIRNLTILTLCCITVFACNSINKGNHLPMPKMEAVIYDITIAEAYSTKARDNTNFGGMKNLDSLGDYYKEIFKHHGITQQEFTESLKWYKSRPDDIDSIYTHLSIKADKENAAESKKKKLPPAL